MSNDWHNFKVGDLVTRDGTDVHRVIRTNAIEGQPGTGDMIEVQCVKAPAGGWAKVGDREDNCAHRYEFAGAVIDANSHGIPTTARARM